MRYGRGGTVGYGRRGYCGILVTGRTRYGRGSTVAGGGGVLWNTGARAQEVR